MKISLLPDQDLARIAPLSRDQKIIALRRLKSGRPPYSYAPVRSSGLDILGVAPGPLFSGSRAPLTKVEEAVRRNARTPREREANIEVARGLYQFAEEQEIKGRREEFRPFPLGRVDGFDKVEGQWIPKVIDR